MRHGPRCPGAGPRSSMVRVALGPGVHAPWSWMIAARPMVCVAVISELVLDDRRPADGLRGRDLRAGPR